MEQNELQHHGILGQRWGVRRYQNADGTLTTAGKLRQSQHQYDKEDRKNKQVTSKLNSDKKMPSLTRLTLSNYNEAVGASKRADYYERNYHINQNALYSTTSQSMRKLQDKHTQTYEKFKGILDKNDQKFVESYIKKNMGNMSTTSLSEYDISRGKKYMTSKYIGQFIGGIPGNILAGKIYNQATRRKARELDKNRL